MTRHNKYVFCSFGSFWIYIKCRLKWKLTLLLCLVNDFYEWIKRCCSIEEYIKKKMSSPHLLSSYTTLYFTLPIITLRLFEALFSDRPMEFLYSADLSNDGFISQQPLHSLTRITIQKDKCWPACSHQHKTFLRGRQNRHCWGTSEVRRNVTGMGTNAALQHTNIIRIAL